MNEVFSIIIYEKDKNLNSILIEQFTYNQTYKLILINDKEIFLKKIKENFFNVCIVNLDIIGNEVKNFIDAFYTKNIHKNIIFLYNKHDNDFVINNKSSFIFMIKPFKFNLLLKHVKRILSNNNENTKIFLMKNLIFVPNEKMLKNRDTNKKEHLTEKETQLLEYLYKNQNYEILKKNLLISIWGINENINTHTLETHVYRLRQKLNKLEPKLTFSLNNLNGKYIFKNIE